MRQLDPCSSRSASWLRRLDAASLIVDAPLLQKRKAYQSEDGLVSGDGSDWRPREMELFCGEVTKVSSVSAGSSCLSKLSSEMSAGSWEMLEKSAEINAKDNDGVTALIFASARGRQMVVLTNLAGSFSSSFSGGNPDSTS